MDIADFIATEGKISQLAQGLQWSDITDLIISEGEISPLNQGLQ